MPCDLWIEIPHAYSQNRGDPTSFSGSWRRCATFFSPSSIENSRSPIARTISPGSRGLATPQLPRFHTTERVDRTSVSTFDSILVP